MAEPVLRPAAEVLYRDELAALAAVDTSPRPRGWRLSPRAVRTFVLGSGGEPLPRPDGDGDIVITQKFFGDDALVERAIVTLASPRALLLVGEPGTAKSMLSELLAAAATGTSLLTVQGSAATTEDQIKYSWNYALLLAKGPGREALVPSPLYTAMREGKIARFEELTRCPVEVQDGLVSVLSDKVLLVPELPGDEGVLFAREGFNLIATANSRDRGVSEMSAALKRRFNFETVRPIRDLAVEVALVEREVEKLLVAAGAFVPLPRDTVELLVTAFQELRAGKSREGVHLDQPASALSTAEAIATLYTAALHAHYYGSGTLGVDEVVMHLPGAVLKDATEDAPRLRRYFETVVRERAEKRGGAWAALLEAARKLGRDP
ncbi:ATP-binding protein [Polyangium aurulentum]|uniref:ATP-binding protein n=1 Tax=Polyangium aurulentum TaxID=2567896 RepID=UPI0010AE577F|nr:AAA family ATPase [Polyangium aurulentum]UQA59085.1 AAA family ATPase [Polyangium aurulentum]